MNYRSLTQKINEGFGNSPLFEAKDEEDIESLKLELKELEEDDSKESEKKSKLILDKIAKLESEEEEEEEINEAITNHDEMTELAEKSSELRVLIELEQNFGITKMKKFFAYLVDEGITYENISKIGLESHLKDEPKSTSLIFKAVIRYYNSRELKEFADDYRRLVLDESNDEEEINEARKRKAKRRNEEEEVDGEEEFEPEFSDDELDEAIDDFCEFLDLDDEEKEELTEKARKKTKGLVEASRVGKARKAGVRKAKGFLGSLWNDKHY